MRRREWIAWAAAVIGIAVLVHSVTLHFLPRLIMARTVARLGAPNAMHFGKRPDAAARRVVRPSPDLVYAVCPFDLSQGPLRLTAPVPHTTYWSVAAFDAATNNFFVRNDRQIAGDRIEIIALRPGMAPPVGGAAERIILYAPTTKGLFLLRMLINDERLLAELDAIRRQSACRSLAPQP